MERQIDIIYRVQQRCFSFATDFPENAIAERFFEEDHLIDTWRPRLNIDSEGLGLSLLR